ncbi:adenylosuccinate synthase [Alkalicoccobacillus murimartini]|uniref:Adenylosuccinate synthetase n=1 Tax=Alkalicoccobacillus murimartini TaxID=171685 RepID=A0ABT9YHT8_9BACI|nr:adenylosuccinate synthase [Alkalicoccobacillus murimartini]MDQ0207423.1 adenylosuccinate synthase [Alkalicoccobacillus murimartini]
MGHSKAVVGINWGDEGKGRIVDYLAKDSNVVVRYQGGNNAGHTVINTYGTFKLHLLPSGVFHKDTVNVLGAGMVIDLEQLSIEYHEIQSRIDFDIDLKISDKATILLPYHVLLDKAEEERLSDKKFGSTQKGIAPAYGDKFMKRSLKIGDLYNMNYVEEKLSESLEWVNHLLTEVYELPAIELGSVMDWIQTYRDFILKFVTDTDQLNKLYQEKSVLFEAQLGALRDIDYGIYPYTTSSSVLASNIPIGAGYFGRVPSEIIGVVKAFSSCVGEGPFVTELNEEDSHFLREKGEEYGAATGRPRRVGHFDAIASAYGVKIQAATELALTKLDTLSGINTLKICTAYEVNGENQQSFPHTSLLHHAKPVYEEFEGWDEDITGVRNFEDLPKNAQRYVSRIEELLHTTIKSISVGPERSQIILL